MKRTLKTVSVFLLIAGFSITAMGATVNLVDNSQAPQGSFWINEGLHWANGTQEFFVEDAEMVTVSSVTETIQEQADWNEGLFDSTSADRDDNSGDLGIGYRNGTSNDEIIGYYRMDRESTGAVVDYSGENNDATNENAQRGFEGPFNTNSFNFSENRYVDTPIQDSFEEMSFSLWMRSQKGVGEGEHYGIMMSDPNFDASSGGINLYVRLEEGNDGEEFSFSVNGTNIRTGVIDKQEWIHVAGTFDGTNMKLYKNGEEIISGTAEGPINMPENVRLGRWHDSNYHPERDFRGRMSEVQIKDEALTEDEIIDLYLNGDSGPFEGNYSGDSIDLTSDQKLSGVTVNATNIDERKDTVDWNGANSEISTDPDDWIFPPPTPNTGLTAEVETTDVNGETVLQYDTNSDDGRHEKVVLNDSEELIEGSDVVEVTALGRQSPDGADVYGYTPGNEEWGMGAVTGDGEGYRAFVTGFFAEIRLEQMDDWDNTTQIDSYGNSELDGNADQWTWIRLRFNSSGSGVEAKARYWFEGESEGTSWDVSADLTDENDITNVGFAGFDSSENPERIADLKFMGVGVDGESAPTEQINDRTDAQVILDHTDGEPETFNLVEGEETYSYSQDVYGGSADIQFELESGKETLSPLIESFEVETEEPSDTGPLGSIWIHDDKLRWVGRLFQDRTESSVESQTEFNEGDFNATSSDRDDNSGDIGLGYLNGSLIDRNDQVSSTGWWTAGNRPDLHISGMESQLTQYRSSRTNITLQASNSGFGTWEPTVSLWNIPQNNDPQISELASANLPDEAYAITSADLTEDGTPEVIVGVRDFGNDLYVYRWNENDNLEEVDGGKDTGGTQSVSAGDVTGDGSMDVVTVGEADYVDVWSFENGELNNLDSVFTSDTKRTSGLGDFTGNGQLEIVTAGNSPDGGGNLSIWEWNSGELQLLEDDQLTRIRSVSVGDVTQNGEPNIVIGDQGSNVRLYELDGSSTLNELGTGQISDNIRATGVGDITGDGNVEMVGLDQDAIIGLFNWDAATNEVKEVDTASLSSASYTVSVGDITRDGDYEILVGTNSGDIEIWEWSSDLNRIKIFSDMAADRFLGIGFVDLTGDGIQEIISAPRVPEFSVFNQQGVSSEFIGEDTVSFTDSSGGTEEASIEWTPQDGAYNLVATVDSSLEHTSVMATTEDPSSAGKRMVQQIESDLIGYWRMDRNIDENGGTVKDYSGNQNDGTNMGATTGTTGVFNTNAFDLNAADYDRINISGFGWNDNNLTISLWLNPDDLSSRTRFVFLGDNDANQQVQLEYRDDTLIWYYYDGNSEIGIAERDQSTQLTENQWQHVAATFDTTEGNWSLYKNGQHTESKIEDVTLNIEDGIDNNIGTTAPDNDEYPYDGKVDEVQIHTEALTQPEIKELYLYGTDGQFQGDYKRTVGIDDTPQELLVNSESVSSSTDLELVLEYSDQTETIQITESGETNHQLDFNDGSGDVKVEVKMNSTNPSTTPVVKDFSVITGEKETLWEKVEMYVTGSLAADQETGPVGSAWMETDGALHYVDQNQDERVLQP